MTKIKTNSTRIGELVRDYLKELGKRGGSVKSEKKAKAARENGKKRKKKASVLSILFLLAACNGGGGGGASGGSPISGSWESLAVPYNYYLLVDSDEFILQNGSCTMSGKYNIYGTTISLSYVQRTNSCVSGYSSFVCTFSMASNNQLSLNCPNLSANFTRR